MGFLEQYDAVPDSEPQKKLGVFVQWLRTDWRGMYAELRASRPVLKTPLFVLVSRAEDVIDVLGQPSLYTVRPYQPKMDPSVGPFMLARDETEINWNDKAVMKSLLRWSDLPLVRQMAVTAARDGLESAKADGQIDLVPAVGRHVPLKIVQGYFGFPGPSDEAMLRWSKATQSDMFRNPTNDPAVHAANLQAGAEMRAWLWEFIAGKLAQPVIGDDDAVSRLLRMTRSDNTSFDASRVVSNICGLLVGAIETSAQAIVQAVQQILLRPEWAEKAIQAAQEDDAATLDPIVWEALRYNPITTFVVRLTSRPTVLMGNTATPVPLPAGTPVAAAIGSAMFDPAMFPDPDSFRVDRPQDAYLHLGYGHHECLGKYVGLQLVPAAVGEVLKLPGLHLLDGEAGEIDFDNGPFPEKFVVGYSASPWSPDRLLESCRVIA